MPPVFAHGRLRLYLLKLLDEAPRHGYEVIRLLEERFQGLYAPSAGTVYPRLAKLEAEGLVTHTTEGGRKVYAITDAGRAELAERSGELADLELEIRESVAELAAEIRADVRGAAGDLRREMRAAAGAARQGNGPDAHDEAGGADDREAWRAAKEEMRRVKQEWKEQARRAKDESRRARDEAQRARRQAKEAQERARTQAQEEVQRIAQRVQEQVQDHFARGDWPTGLREGLSELAKEVGDFGKDFGKEFGKDWGFGRTDTGTAASRPDYSTTPEDFPAGYAPAWAHEDAAESTGDPARDLERLLDRFRDDIRDAARDRGVSPDQLRDARRHLSAAAAHIGAVLRTPQA
ncbi:helix-turn-helix transcriptional regulator [Streptomyces parvulus]|uniref:Helix-turn-helix transcriptional regulator n=1 Tax=Streptomyces parvulus TaxID=146923 RepID=A0ABV5D487_9ACTN|nr:MULTISPECIES: PadR family transcriptional regulator [Streptomyces]MCC9154358.1 helix-turn-helix transcriptional regulator [Streptomyces parvulus]MCE7686198.1 helix-turn-helix transcriptional regulator [Streptomyces parvulus]WML82505.1 helix-turn-helix transcriptional regulator [Streptomyces sp. VNUA74]